MTASTPENIFIKLHEKFGQNLQDSFKKESLKFKEIEIKARAFAIFGQILSEKKELTNAQKEIVPIFNEIFKDNIISLYLSSCCIDISAQLTLRRVLESGISIVYLWDLPHIFYGWSKHDKDLVFTTMVEHFTCDSYKTFIESENKLFKKQDVPKFVRGEADIQNIE